jgi:CRP/FNR family transcriptional regulator
MRHTTSPSPNDLAALLPRRPIQKFPARRVLYGPEKPGHNLYLVESGRVVIANFFDAPSPTVKRIIGPGGLFGEVNLIGSGDASETSRTLDITRLVWWSRPEVEQQINRDPHLGLLLVRYFAHYNTSLQERMEALALRKTRERVILGLLELGEELGTPSKFGRTMAALTHQMIAEYIGTSREIVTAVMTTLRREGWLHYSRKYIEIDVKHLLHSVCKCNPTEPANVGLVHAATS